MPPDLVVFCHLRWNWVWQRPQHLISRIGRGRRVWFVEEPRPCDVDGPRLRTEEYASGLTRVWVDVPDQGRHVGFEEEILPAYAESLRTCGAGAGHPVVWLYSPLPLGLADGLEPRLVVYDVMDDLASFLRAPELLVIRHRQALARADVVFAGGRTLHLGVLPHRPDAHLFPSGVEPEHYESARRHRTT